MLRHIHPLALQSEPGFEFLQGIAIDIDTSDANQNVNEKLAHSRWRCFSREWIAEHKGDSLDISWLKDADSVDSANLPEPSVLANEAKQELVGALADLDKLLAALGEVK